MFVVPVDCGSHIVLGWVWFFVVVMEVIVVEEAGFTKLVSDSFQVKESVGKWYSSRESLAPATEL